MADDWADFPSDEEIAAGLEANRVRLEAEAKEVKRKKREDYIRRQRNDAETWYEDEPAQRVQLVRQITKHLLSVEGRDGPTEDQLSDILDYDSYKLAVCIEKLKQSRGIYEDDHHLYHYKVWRQLHPERRGVVRHIGTVPRAVLDHKEAMPARKIVAAALSTHFYQTRRARAKQKALSYPELAEVARVAEKTAKRAVEWLVTEDLLR